MATVDALSTLAGRREAVKPRITARMVEFVAGTRFEDLPAEVVARAKLSMLDTLGVCLGGAVERAPRLLADFVRGYGWAAVVSVVGQGFRTTPHQAAWVNGTAADVLGFSDLSVPNMHHPSASICPTVWAIGEELGASGKDILLAHVLGVEVGCKIGLAIKPGVQLQGWHPLAVLNTFGSAAAASKLLGLDAAAMANALGIAGAEAAGIRASMGTMSKAYGAGRAARDGIVAAKLAAAGYTGPTGVLEARDGFLQTFGNGADGEAIAERLGHPYEFVSPGLTYKAYPSCTRSHPGIRAVLELRQAHGLTADQVEWVDCQVTLAVEDYLKFHNPKSKFEAKYSLEFCAAVALLDGAVVLSSFSDERVRDPKVVDLMRRITVRVSPEFAQYGYMPDHAPHGCIVTIGTRDGARYVRRADRGPWEPPNTPSWEALVEKFRGCAELVLPRDRIEAAAGLVRDLERLDDVRRLMDLVRNG